jgi:hypothetical protein
MVACKKNSDPPPNNPGGGNDTTENTDPNELKAASLDSFLQVNTFQLTNYYSDSAIDYDETDTIVKSETELWAYVSPWLKDDTYTFGSDGKVTINQNDAKIPNDASPTLTRPYQVVADNDGVKITFLTNEYNPLDYRLIEFSDTALKVSAIWNGHKVNSDYKVLK